MLSNGHLDVSRVGGGSCSWEALAAADLAQQLLSLELREVERRWADEHASLLKQLAHKDETIWQLAQQVTAVAQPSALAPVARKPTVHRVGHRERPDPVPAFALRAAGAMVPSPTHKRARAKQSAYTVARPAWDDMRPKGLNGHSGPPPRPKPAVMHGTSTGTSGGGGGGAAAGPKALKPANTIGAKKKALSPDGHKKSPNFKQAKVSSPDITSHHMKAKPCAGCCPERHACPHACMHTSALRDRLFEPMSCTCPHTDRWSSVGMCAGWQAQVVCRGLSAAAEGTDTN